MKKVYNTFLNRWHNIGNTILCRSPITNAITKTADYLKTNYSILNSNANEYLYRGLCDTASNKFIENLRAEIDGVNKITIDPKQRMTITYAESIHGELKHDYRIPSMYWFYEHTVAVVALRTGSNKEETVVVDLTSMQFWNYGLYNIPEKYSGNVLPWYFYPDHKNPRYTDVLLINKLFNKINDTIRIKRKYKLASGEVRYSKQRILDILEYQIYGRISDFFHMFYKVFHREDYRIMESVAADLGIFKKYQ